MEDKYLDILKVIREHSSDGNSVDLRVVGNAAELTIYRVWKIPMFGGEFRRKWKTVQLSIKGGEIFSEPDRSVDVKGYMEYCESGFNENNMKDRELDLLHACVGMAGECGELLEEVKKHIFHGKELDIKKVVSESGDLAWYFMNFLRLMEISFSNVITYNRAKLDDRYPNGRSSNYQINRKNENHEKLSKQASERKV